jgi:Cupin domain
MLLSISIPRPTSFAVRSGRLKVVLDDKEHFVGPGADIVVPRGRPHFFVNANDGATEMTVELRPAQQHVRFFANMASLAQDHPEWFSDQGLPHFLLAALMLHSYRDHPYGVVLPQPLPKLLFAGLAPVARMKGFALAFEPKSQPTPTTASGTQEPCRRRSPAWPQAEVMRTRIEGLKSPRSRRPLTLV